MISQDRLEVHHLFITVPLRLGLYEKFDNSTRPTHGLKGLTKEVCSDCDLKVRIALGWEQPLDQPGDFTIPKEMG